MTTFLATINNQYEFLVDADDMAQADEILKERLNYPRNIVIIQDISEYDAGILETQGTIHLKETP